VKSSGPGRERGIGAVKSSDAGEEQHVIAEQVAYYRARAPEYDDWFFRRGQYDHGAEWNRRWRDEVGVLRRALDAAHLAGRALELACGTGLWTERLAPIATTLTCVDASPEVIALNRKRMGAAQIDYVCADLFEWEPAERYDFVFFGFWLSHVPAGAFIPFWSMVARALAPGGRVFFVDSRNHPASREGGYSDWAPRTPPSRSRRRLRDGREFEIVKIFHKPDELEAQLRALGWRVVVQGTPTFFLHGLATRDDAPPAAGEIG
jgi:demethylmenaquinone methyltransferase/2-methoxy-6-polyprenyl-1,4-benzoquinol methylase